MSRTRRRRIFAIVLTVLVVFGLLAAAVFVRMRAAPEPARLLPDGQGIFYANLKPLRKFTNFGETTRALTPGYRSFVDQTGFEFERDLSEIALAMHAPQDPNHETRYSEIMVGRFNSTKLAGFLARNARSREDYRNHEVFLVPYEDRVVRVTVLSVDMVAASNTGDPAQIDHIIDAFLRSGFGAGGPRLLEKYYHHVPFGSLAWLITEVESPTGIAFSGSFNPLPFIRQLFGGGMLVGSARYNGDVQLRMENFLKDEAAAKDRAEQLQNLLSLYKTTESQTRPEHPNAEMEATLNSLSVQQKGARVQVNASVARGLIEKLFEAPIEPESQATVPSPVAPKRHRKKR